MQHLPTTRKAVCKMRDDYSFYIVAAVEASDVLLPEVSASRRITCLFWEYILRKQTFHSSLYAQLRIEENAWHT